MLTQSPVGHVLPPAYLVAASAEGPKPINSSTARHELKRIFMIPNPSETWMMAAGYHAQALCGRPTNNAATCAHAAQIRLRSVILCAGRGRGSGSVGRAAVGREQGRGRGHGAETVPWAERRMETKDADGRRLGSARIPNAPSGLDRRLVASCGTLSTFATKEAGQARPFRPSLGRLCRS